LAFRTPDPTAASNRLIAGISTAQIPGEECSTRRLDAIRKRRGRCTIRQTIFGSQRIGDRLEDAAVPILILNDTLKLDERIRTVGGVIARQIKESLPTESGRSLEIGIE
jgi:hypothetical protein